MLSWPVSFLCIICVAISFPFISLNQQQRQLSRKQYIVHKTTNDTNNDNTSSISSQFGKCGDCYCFPSVNEGCPLEFQNADPYIHSMEIIDAFQHLQPVFTYSIDCNPYEEDLCDMIPPSPSNNELEGQVCAFRYHYNNTTNNEKNSVCPNFYEMVTFANRTEAIQNGAFVTHEGACGLCSTSQDLAVYMKLPDMTTEGKLCGIQAKIFGMNRGLACFEALGFTTV